MLHNFNAPSITNRVCGLGPHWLVSQMLRSSPHLKEVFNGDDAHVFGDPAAAMKFWEGSSDCPAYCDLLAQQQGRLAFDIGANGGFVTGMFASGFEEVIALEPAE